MQVAPQILEGLKLFRKTWPNHPHTLWLRPFQILKAGLVHRANSSLQTFLQPIHACESASPFPVTWGHYLNTGNRHLTSLLCAVTAVSS